jgi:hypothetical protein
MATKTIETMQTKPLAEALSLISKLTGADTISLASNKGRLRVSGENNGRSFTCSIDTVDTSVWECTIPKSILDQVLKGRKELQLFVRDARLYTAAGNFKADFATEPYNAGPEIQKANSTKISDAQQQSLLYSKSVARLSPVFQTDTVFTVSSNPERTLAACYDGLHCALVESEGLKGKMDFSFPTATFAVIADAARNSTFNMSTTSASICAWNDDWELVLPFVQQEAERSAQQVQEFIAVFGPSMIRCNCSQLHAAISTATSAIELGGSVTLTVKDSLLLVSGQSSLGNVREKIVCKQLSKACEPFKIDPAVALSLLANSPSEYIELGVHDNRFFFIRAEDETSKITYIGALSQS